ncbi:uncharacterized N-acetyltransferase C9.02c-like [Acanthaster planci]|uniref:Serotonin N-acetyltransferase n=1 Tax=Acanthaster planci TaxID=133434 RepID=A0A8B7ZGD1_ACAPL|nr:uncharacterized N-acetyltransferase C9.02c-like [Acanthaster planci]XP_022102296.1 uncharacterized N-acetyltransferase C9.02c-like [Acanthaster planci]
MASSSSTACIRRVSEQEVHAAWLLQAGLASEEETLPEGALQIRQKVAPDLFWGYFENGRLIGFVSGGKTSRSKMAVDAKFVHDPDGCTVCLHTLRVQPDYQGKGIETILIDHLLWYVEENLKGVNKVNLICHDKLVQFYEGLHFRCLGPSDVRLGSKQWFDMEYEVTHESTGFA